MPMRLTLPAGSSIRQLAEQLGVSAETLAEHAGVADVEAILDVERLIDVPDGLLDRRVKDAPLRDVDAGRHSGMNPWLALDIEHRRTQVGGGLKGRTATDEERDALDEGWRAYRRFEPDSNDLAIDLWQPLTRSQTIAVRAEAYAGQACAFAQRHLLFGAPVGQSRPQALSAARGAVMAAPKMAVAHLGMALALSVDGGDDERDSIRNELERGIELDPNSAWCWAALADHLLGTAELTDARAACGVAREIDAEWIFALEIAGELAFRDGDRETAEQLFEQAFESLPTYANAAIRYAVLLRGAGEHDRSADLATRAMQRATQETHRQHLERVLYR